MAVTWADEPCTRFPAAPVVVLVLLHVAPEYWVVELGREEEVKHPIFPHTMIFVTEKENAVNSVKEAKDQAEKWLELGA